MATILHRIKAYLYNNSLTGNPEDYLARVSSDRSLGIREICESAENRGGADLPAVSIQHGVSLFLKEMAYLLCDGFSVNTGYFTASPHIQGVFNSPDETFSPGKHKLLFKFRQGDLLREELQSVEVEIMGMADTEASISQVTDIRTGSVNDLLTPNHILRVNGRKIRIAGDGTGIGVYFVNQSTGERTKVDTTDIVTNDPSELVLVIPALITGAYKLQVTTRFSRGFLLKEPRTVVFDKVLTVQ